jgi:FAD/FMN-containing dehydrogenase
MTSIYDELRNCIKVGTVLTPTAPGYDESILRWSAASVRQAAVVVQAGNAAEVSTAVKFATKHGVPLTVHGGGHSTSGASSIEDGMVIDLRRINHIDIDSAAQMVKIGGGCRWREVDDATAKVGLATVGGTVNDTGVGGFICGGGYGYLSPKHGLTIDNLLEVQMVVADGSIVNASSTENSDLFWAVRGAGQHFGVSNECPDSERETVQ